MVTVHYVIYNDLSASCSIDHMLCYMSDKTFKQGQAFCEETWPISPYLVLVCFEWLLFWKYRDVPPKVDGFNKVYFVSASSVYDHRFYAGYDFLLLSSNKVGM